MVGVAFVTLPNFPAYVIEMCNLQQQLPLIQVLHDVTSAFDHVSSHKAHIANYGDLI